MKNLLIVIVAAVALGVTNLAALGNSGFDSTVFAKSTGNSGSSGSGSRGGTGGGGNGGGRRNMGS